MRLMRSLLFLVIFQMCIYKVCTKFQSWWFKYLFKYHFGISGPRQRSWDLHEHKGGKIYRKIQRWLIFLCHFYCCVQLVHRTLEKHFIRSNRLALKATSNCHHPLPDTQLTVLTIGSPKVICPKVISPWKNHLSVVHPPHLSVAQASLLRLSWK